MNRKSASVLFRYITVGIIGTMTHLGVLAALVEIQHVKPIIASSIGFIVTLVISYALNYYWTFGSTRNHLASFVTYGVVSSFGLLLNTIIMFVTVDLLAWWYFYGQLLVILIIPPTNYFMNKYWTFAVAR